MKIGIPKEIKSGEGRVGMIPDACAELLAAGHQVYVQSTAGQASGFADADYARIGATLLPDAETLYGTATMIVKVKEPVDHELNLLQSHHRLFSYLHLAALPELTQKLVEIGLTAVAFETVAVDGKLPLLAPMSDIAGRISIQLGSNLLFASQGGKGRLLGGLPGVARGKVVVLGAGVAGGNAVRMAVGLGSLVTVFDRKRERLEEMRSLGDGVETSYPYPEAITQAVAQADLLIGAILIPGAKAQKIVSRQQISNMQSGSVVMDIAVDQGGCMETTRPTSWGDPTYLDEGIIHCHVTNLPGAVPLTASQALSSAITPYVLQLAEKKWQENEVLKQAVNVQNGKVVLQVLVSNTP